MKTNVLFVALAVGCAACADSFPVPAGALIACNTNDDCPTGSQCDTAIPSQLGRGRCVTEIVAPPAFTLSADPPLGPRRQPFTFAANGATNETFRWELLIGQSTTPVVAAETGPVFRTTFESLGRTEFCDAVECRDAIPVRVRAIATNAIGKSTSDVVTVVLLNHAPVADFGDDLFISEQGVPEVELDICGGLTPDAGCTSYDPDGDRLSFSGFRQVSGPDAGVSMTDGRLVVRPPPGAVRPLVFEGTIDDGIRSSTGRVQVHRGSFGWTFVGRLDQTYRVHADFRATPRFIDASDALEPFYGPDAIVSDGMGGWWFADANPDQFAGRETRTSLVHVDAQLREVAGERTTISNLGGVDAVRGFVPPTATQSGCIGFAPSDWRRDAGLPDPVPGFARVPRGQPLGPVLSFRAPDGGLESPISVVSAGPSGNCWTIRLASGATGFSGQGGFVAQLTPGDTIVGQVDVAGRPTAAVSEPDGTLWLLERFLIPLPDGGSPPQSLNPYRSELRRYAPSGAVTRVDVGNRYLTQLALRRGGGVWSTDLHASRLVRILADGTVSEVDGLTLGTSNTANGSLAVDPATGTLWAVNSLGPYLMQLEEVSDGGVRALSVTGAEALPPGLNPQPWEGRLAVDPVTGSVSTFVGQVSSAYAFWVTVPPHARRTDRVPGLLPPNAIIRGDPTSGALWVSGPGSLRRIDGKGRTLVGVPNLFGESFAQTSAPFVVDRRGQAWITTWDGGPFAVLRAIDRHGDNSRNVALPFVPGQVALASDFNANTGVLREVLCATGRSGEGTVRVDLASGVVTPLLGGPLRADGGTEDPFLCAPTPSGQVWVFATERQPRGDPTAHVVWKYAAGVTTPMSTLLVEPQSPGATVQIMGAVADETRDALYYGTWRFPSYDAELRRLSSNGATSDVRVLQGMGRLGIPLNVFLRPVCPQPTPACAELWASNRLSEVHRFGLAGDDIETFLFGREEGPLDLVP